MFISFEGIDGSGKTTAARVLSAWLDSQDRPHLSTREPGGTPVAEGIRALLLGRWREGMAVTTEVLLLFAARHQHMHGVIRPALAAGKWVLCDRFTDSTLVYQEQSPWVLQLAGHVHGDCWPDLTFWFDVPVQTAQRRIRERVHGDRFDGVGFDLQQRIANGYRLLYERFPQRIKRIDASESVDRCAAQIRSCLQPYV